MLCCSLFLLVITGSSPDRLVKKISNKSLNLRRKCFNSSLSTLFWVTLLWSLPSAGSLQLRTQTFFPSFAPSPVNWLTPHPLADQQVFYYFYYFYYFIPSCGPTWNTSESLRIYSSHRLVILFVWSTFLLAGHVILLVLWRCQTAKESYHQTQSVSSVASGLQLGSPVSVTPLRLDHWPHSLNLPLMW